ncbi:MAG: hypothetical protein Q4D56_14145, partial [Bacteroides sp.]|nr:hypothetical protein [Bacteroides sp.]
WERVWAINGKEVATVWSNYGAGTEKVWSGYGAGVVFSCFLKCDSTMRFILQHSFVFSDIRKFAVCEIFIFLHEISCVLQGEILHSQ